MTHSNYKEVDVDDLMEMDTNSSTAVNNTRNVTLSQAELEQLMDARAEARTKELEARILEMEGLLKSFLGKGRGKVTPDALPRDLEELEQDIQPPQQHKPKEEDDWHAPFGESTYTLLYTSTAKSQGFWYGIFVYGLQIATILLTQIDILDLASEDNPLKLPPMVDPTVTWAQGITIFMALAFQSDLIEATLKLQDGFHPEVLETHPGATFSTWLISCLAQLFAGFLLLATIFILTMQVDDVISIMLNFAALHFMAEIDDIGFAIAKWGFVTNTIQRETISILDFRIPKRKTLNRSRRVLYVLTLGGLFAGYGTLKKRQLDGKYLPTNIYAQFGDAYNSKIPFYSGMVTSVVERTAVRREYRDAGRKKLIVLAYCQALQSWTFSFFEDNDPCEYFAKSHESTTYDVTTIPNSEWEVKDSIGRLQPFDSFSLVSRDCDIITCQGVCGADRLCQCNHGQFGIDCDLSKVCPTLTVDPRFGQFPSVRVPSEEALSGLEKPDGGPTLGGFPGAPGRGGASVGTGGLGIPAGGAGVGGDPGAAPGLDGPPGGGTPGLGGTAVGAPGPGRAGGGAPSGFGKPPPLQVGPGLRGSIFDGIETFGISDEFKLLENAATKEYVALYNMPVYYSNKTYPANILFLVAVVGYSLVSGT